MLIGAGKFGQNYIRILKNLQEQSEIDFVGVGVSTPESADKVNREHGVMTTTNFRSLLSEIDAVCIVTPPETHYEIIKDCLPFVNVLSEKPLTLKLDEVRDLSALASSNQKILMTGQLFRFHPVSNKVLEIIKENFNFNSPKQFTGVFINPESSFANRQVSFEFIHWYDLFTYLFPSFNLKSIDVTMMESRMIENVSILYENNYSACQGKYHLGWEGLEKRRVISIDFGDNTYISADYLTNNVIVNRHGVITVYDIPDEDTLLNEIKIFISSINGQIDNPVPPESVENCVKVAEEIESRYNN